MHRFLGSNGAVGLKARMDRWRDEAVNRGRELEEGFQSGIFVKDLRLSRMRWQDENSEGERCNRSGRKQMAKGQRSKVKGERLRCVAFARLATAANFTLISYSTSLLL